MSKYLPEKSISHGIEEGGLSANMFQRKVLPVRAGTSLLAVLLDSQGKEELVLDSTYCIRITQSTTTTATTMYFFSLSVPRDLVKVIAGFQFQDGGTKDPQW